MEETRNHSFSFGLFRGPVFLFALAVSRGTGAQLVVIEEQGVILHAAVRSGKGFRDLRGDVDETTFVSPYVSGKAYFIRDTTEEELLRVSQAANNEPITDEQIRRARQHAESAWPEWKWKNSQLKNVMVFACELEALCAKHGVMVREPIPASPMYLYPMEGDERFEVEHFPNPTNQFLLRRIIK